ncbi:MAG TPA: homoserine dehydrogenase [Acidimicrobiales bacterium]
MTAEPVRVAILGCGTVGSEVARALCDPARAVGLEAAAGAPLQLVGVAVARAGVPREGVDPSLVTTDATALVDGAGADVVVELTGDVDAALGLIARAIDGGASVVTANKALLATHLGELSARASARGVDLFFEAAVAGAVPVVRVLRTSLAGQRLDRVLGIVNGTTNFILTTMTKEGRDYEDVLADAQARGYAESDPSADVDGHDAAQKAALLATLAFGCEVTDADVPREGIARVTVADLDAAGRLGYAVRLLAIAERTAAGAISVRVHPSMVPIDHPLASVDGASNAVFVEGPGVGPLMFLGAGAGGPPTASAVLGDLVASARNRIAGTVDPAPEVGVALELQDPGDAVCEFYLSLAVADRPGVLASVATVFGRHSVSIRSMEQIGMLDDARLVFLTHDASEADMAATVDELERLDAVKAVGVLLRVVAGGAM